MESNNIAFRQPCDEKAKVAYALNLCAVSISQIIDSKDLVVLKQERESILNNINLQNFVKHPALLDVLRQILDTITYLEIQAGDLSFVEKEYQQKLKNAIWSAVPSPGSLFVGSHPAMLALAVASQVGTGYMNYRRNKSQYALEKEKSIWELKRHELEQLYGLRAQLFETAWKLSADYNFDDKFRLTEKQLSRYSEALLEEDPLKRFERLDVISDRFTAFPPFWYHKGNAAMEVFRDKQYSELSHSYKAEALEAYKKFGENHFEFLREDIIAASCFIEHISLLEQGDPLIEGLLNQALQLAGENYDVLQQSVLVNIHLKKYAEVILPLREMIANNYNVGLNAILLSRIYFKNNSKFEYEKLCLIAGKDNVLSWSEDADLSERLLVDSHKQRIAGEYSAMVRRIAFELSIDRSLDYFKSIYNEFNEVSSDLQGNIYENKKIIEHFSVVKSKLKKAATSRDDKDKSILDFSHEANMLCNALISSESKMQIDDNTAEIIKKIKAIAKS